MFNFFLKKQSPTLDFSIIGIDIHSHLIAGIDDGSNNLKTASELVKRMADLGFKKIITTPHIMSGYYPNTVQEVLMGLESLKAFLKKDKIEIPISAAAEYFLDENFLVLLECDQLLPLPNKHLLVEMSLMSPFDGLYDYLFQIQLKGYSTVLAHPERYIYYHNDYETYQDLKEKGVLFQVNVLSILGYYGKYVKQTALRLLKDNMVELIGTDMHHIRHANYIRENISNKDLQKILLNHEFQNTKLFNKDEILPVTASY